MVSVLLRERNRNCAEITEQRQHLVVGGVIWNLKTRDAVSMSPTRIWYMKQPKGDLTAIDLLSVS